MKALVNGRIITATEILTGHVLLFNDTIVNIIEESCFAADFGTEIIDVQGRYISPGFINVHIHGCGGADAMDASPETLQKMCASLPKSGVTAFLPTTMTSSLPNIYRSLVNIRQAMSRLGGARVLGAHMEGPFISRQFKGAQAAEHILEPRFSLLTDYTDVVKLITVAPEKLDGDFLLQCRAHNIIVSMGHTAADYNIAQQAIDGGISHATHLFNTYLPLHHRQPGAVGAALDSDIVCELIADNIHVHPMMQRLLYKMKRPDKLVLITDSMRACMLPDGESELGGQRVFVKNGEARLADGALAGSILLMNEAVRNFRHNTDASIVEVVRMAGLNQAQELELADRYGSLAVGKAADITVFDENINIFMTFVDGQIVYNSY